MQHPDEFFYLNQGDSAEIEGLMGNDEKEFEATREAFKVTTRSLANLLPVFGLLAILIEMFNNLILFIYIAPRFH